MKSDLMPDLDELEKIGSTIDNDSFGDQGEKKVTEKVYYYDSLGNLCNKENAVRYCVVKYDAYGTELSRDWHTIDLKDGNDNSSSKSGIADFINSIKSMIGKAFGLNGGANFKGSKSIRIIATALAVFIIIVAIVSNIHTCDECDEVFFGSGHTITYFGETERYCDDCYAFD